MFGMCMSPDRQGYEERWEAMLRCPKDIKKSMADNHSIEQRHLNMASIHARNTTPELTVRRYLWRHGFRYRLNSPRLPGKPDLVLRRYRTCIFVNGCFWHGHEGCRYYTVPKTNTSFWTSKIARNKRRDADIQRRLAAMGWHCITVWECELKGKKREMTLQSLAFTLNRIFLQDRTLRYPKPAEEQDAAFAAEPFVGE